MFLQRIPIWTHLCRFETATHADIEAKLEFRDRILSCGYRLALVLPEKLNIPPVVPGSSVSQAQETKMDTQIKVIEKEGPKEAPKSDAPSTSTSVYTNVDSK